jgi:hypothetical protein
MQAKALVAGGTAIVVLAVSCRDATPPPELTEPDQPSYGISEHVVEWLPVGTVIPHGQAIHEPPEPYNARRHGPPGETRHDNAAHLPKYASLPVRQLPPPPAPSSTPDQQGFYSTEMGWYLEHGPSGVYATMDAQLNLWIPEGALPTVLYAPAVRPERGCLEMVVAHTRLDAFETAPAHEFWVWNHCRPSSDNPVLVHDMEGAGWGFDYLRDMAGVGEDLEPMMYAQLYDDDSNDCYDALLYNFTMGRYDSVYSWCGDDSDYWYGWAFWELEEGSLAEHNACDRYPSIQALHVVMLNPNNQPGIHLADSAPLYFETDTATCIDNGSYFILLEESGWQAWTPDNLNTANSGGGGATGCEEELLC